MKNFRGLGASCLAAALLLAGSAHAQSFRGAKYDPGTDTLTVGIAYRGTNPNHDFSLAWDRCQGDAQPYQVAARVIDRQGDDAATKDFVVRKRFSLRDLKCRPARVTLRMGRLASTSVLVPVRR